MQQINQTVFDNSLVNVTLGKFEKWKIYSSRSSLRENSAKNKKNKENA